jgi:hypothetical protein
LLAAETMKEGDSMSKILYACSRDYDFSESTVNKLADICNELVPDNIRTRPEHKVHVKGHLAYAVTMNNNALHESGLCLLLGFLYEKPDTDWVTPKRNYPDGNYALFRNSDDEIEVVSDGSGSRTIWYYHDDELFVASTSQRAIILFLGTFLFDERVIPWMLSTGSLGPQFSWDRRIQRLQADSSVLLNKKTWDLSVKQNPVTFSEEKRLPEEHKELLADSIRRTIKSLESLDFEHWVLPLSGGYDSRGILCFIKEQMCATKNIRAVTWGLEASLTEDGNDAKIAKELARSHGVPHDYYHTDISSEPIEEVIDRFILCGEGRIDQLEGYMDGMEIWRRFYENNVAGVIRGDEGFGWAQVSSELTVKLSLGCALCNDFDNLKKISEYIKLPSQELPPEFKKGRRESLSAWRDRLYHKYRIPTILAALSDIKYSYVEQINPLLSKVILTTVRTIPDNLRTDKALFKEIVDTMEPNIPSADKIAIADSEDILRTKPLVDLLKSEISSDYANQLFGSRFVKYISDGIKEDKAKSKTRKRKITRDISSLLPKFIKNRLRDTVLPPKVDSNVLAFRVFILLKMHKTLKADAAKFSN